MSGWRIILACIALHAGAGAALAEDGSGVSPSRIKLPSGPGSLEGVGENAEANLNMGLLTYSVPMAVPAGHQGLTPQLGLAYGSSGGSSEVGMGWRLAVPRIERMTARGLPNYAADDSFSTDSGGELVRLPGTQIYRERFEGSFVRYSWVDPDRGGTAGYWKAEYPDGRVGYFGARADGTIAPDARMEGASGTFAYYLVELVDPYAHRIEYSYERDAGQPYLARVAWAFSGDAPRYLAELSYEEREDQLSDGKPGVEIRLRRRLTNVRVRVRGELLRRYSLSYEPYSESGGLTRLRSVTTYGTGDSTPYPIAFHFAYTQGFDPLCQTPESCRMPAMQELGSVGADFRTGSADFIDLNGDALPDVVDTVGGTHRVHRLEMSKGGSPSFAQVQTSDRAGSGAMDLANPEVQMVDLDGNGFADMLDGLNGTVLWGGGQGDWSQLQALQARLPAFAADRDLRFVDLDQDHKIDVLRLGRAGSWVHYNQGDHTFAAASTVDGVARGFTEDALQLADMNGDGMLDLAQIGAGVLTYYTNLGRGRFGAGREMFGLPQEATRETLELVDLNGDGLADAVQVQSAEVRFALNRSGLELAPLQTLTAAHVEGALPVRNPETTVRFTDMNGTGSADVVWIEPSGRIRYLELFPERPNLLRRIDNGIGWVIEAEYGTTVDHMARDGGPDSWTHRLPHAMQVLERLVSYDTLSQVKQEQVFHYRNGYYDGKEHQFRGFEEVEVFTSGDDSTESGHAVHHFDVGAEDTYRKGLLLANTVSSDDRVLLETQSTYEDCPVAEVPRDLAESVRFVCPSKTVTTVQEGQAEDTWVTTEERFRHDGYGNRIQHQKLGVTSVGGGACAACDRPDDVQGEPCGPQCTGDELTELVDYVSPDDTSGRWLLGAPYLKRVMGVAGSDVVKEERTYYDGEDFVGLPIGRLERGTVRRVSARREAGQDGSVALERVRHDAHGNVVEVLDPNGNRRLVTYDADGLLLSGEELELGASGAEPYGLRMEVVHDPVLETVVASTGWMRIEAGEAVSERRETAYAYDEFARITAIAKPGDDLSAATQELAYELADPITRIIARSRSESGGELDLEHVVCSDGRGRKLQERTRIEPGRYQVSGFVQFNALGKEQAVYQSYQGTSARCDLAPAAGVLRTETTFDASGRPLQTRYPDDGIYGTRSESRFVYAPLQASFYDPNDTDVDSPHHDTPTTTVTDGLGRTVRLERLLKDPRDDEPAATVTTSFRYDELGRIRSTLDDHRNEHVQRYDLLDRIVHVNHPDAGELRMEYDDAGNLLASTDARGKQTRFTYDEANRRTAMWDADDREATEVSWDYDGNEGCDPATCSGAPGELTYVSYPLLDDKRGSETFAYDARGRVVRSSFARGAHLFAFSDVYDNVDRPTAITYPGGHIIRTEYDGLGRRTAMPEHVDGVHYGPHGQLRSIAFGNGVATSFAYDSLRRVASIETLVPDGPSPVLIDYYYDRAGQIIGTSDGRNLSRTEPSDAATYRYDSLQRLIVADLDPERAARREILDYRFDSIDNLTKATSSLGQTSQVHLGSLRYGKGGAGPHAPTSIEADKGGTEVWGYDRAGHTVQQNETSHEWDFNGRLTGSTVANGQTAVFAYGNGKERTQKREAGTSTDYLTPDFEVRDGIATIYVRLNDQRAVRIETADLASDLLPDLAPAPKGDAAITAADAWVLQAMQLGVEDVDEAGMQFRPTEDASPQQLVASAARRLVLGEDGQAETCFHGNHQGTVIAETDEQGTIFSRSYAYPYGQPRNVNSALPSYWYTGQEGDRATGLSYHSARYLDLRVGRWLSPDPAGIQIHERNGRFGADHHWRRAFSGTDESGPPLTTESPFGYVSNSPLNMTDRSGLVGVGVQVDLTAAFGTIGANWGLNFQYTTEEGFGLYAVVPREGRIKRGNGRSDPLSRVSGFGLTAGAGVTGNIAWRTEDGWSGDFESVSGNVGPAQAGYSRSPRGGTEAASLGLSVGAPLGAALTRTRYIPLVRTERDPLHLEALAGRVIGFVVAMEDGNGPR